MKNLKISEVPAGRAKDEQTSSGQNARGSSVLKRVRGVCALILTAAALFYAFSGVAGYFRSVENLKKADARAARILEDLRRDQGTPLLDEDL